MTPERVLEALGKDPALLWKVALKVRILGPWEEILSDSDSWCRWDPWHRQRATLRAYEYNRCIVWEVRYMGVSGQPEAAVVGGVTTARERIIAEADRVLRAAGYALLNEKVD